jgi:2-phospho-L-lactate transferase/gluconeogenesis factor (CofD/UPF0052 family)
MRSLHPPATDGRRLTVVLFSGGRGSGSLAQELVRYPHVDLTLAINGYDDGKSTGEVRRFLGSSLGPSDFRKNASRLAGTLQTCRPELIELLDVRLPAETDERTALALLETLGQADAGAEPGTTIERLARALHEPARLTLAAWLDRFRAELTASKKRFDFADCAIGNLVFAGAFLDSGGGFNAAVDAYAAMVGLPVGLLENVTDGTNAYLVGLDEHNHVLGSEEAIVDGRRRNQVTDIFLLRRPLTPEECEELSRLPGQETAARLKGLETRVPLNPRLAERIRSADLVIYAAGTQHSSLFPSYLTEGLSDTIAGNLGAMKLLLTNIQADAEIAGRTAVDIVERAVFYLTGKGRLSTPTPALITHYLFNDPGSAEPELPYVPLGRLDALEDPRLVRIGHYEDGVSGRHDASKVLRPFISSFTQRGRMPRVAVWLQQPGSANKLAQTLLELVRGGVADVPVHCTVFVDFRDPFNAEFLSRLPFDVRWLDPAQEPGRAFVRALASERFDYAVAFESSGMYRGEDLVALIGPLAFGRLDAVWGSRRLSVRDVQASLALRYRNTPLLGGISYFGSHALSLAYLLLYGRYVTDTLSGARAVRASYVVEREIDLRHPLANQRLLSALVRDGADLLETPVQFLPLSPERVPRTTVTQGLRSLMEIVRLRFAKRRRAAASVADRAGGSGAEEGQLREGALHTPTDRSVV